MPFNREIQVRTVKIPKEDGTEGRPVIPEPTFEEKVDIIVKGGRKLLVTAIVGVVAYVAADAVRTMVVEVTQEAMKKPPSKK